MSSIVVGRSDGTLTLNGLALVGDVTGNVTGDVSGSAATVTGDTQAAITTLDNLTGYQVSDADLTAIAALAHTDGNFIIGDGDAWVAESGDTARISLGLGTTDSPTFTGLTLTGDISMASTHGIDWGGVSSITCNNTSRDIDINAGKQIALIGGTYISFSTTAGPVSLTASEEIKFKPSGNSDDYLIMQTVSNVPELTTLGDCDLKLSNTLGDSVLVSELDDHLASSSNPHSVDADDVSLGTTDSPEFTGLTLTGDISVNDGKLESKGYGTAPNYGGVFLGYRQDTSIGSGNTLLSIRGGGSDGGVNEQAAEIRFAASEAWEAGKQGTEARIYLNPVGSVTQTLMYQFGATELTIPRDNLKIELGVTDTDFQLYSDGTDACIDFTGSLKVNGAAGVSGSFTTVDSKTVTVADGLITAIV